MTAVHIDAIVKRYPGGPTAVDEVSLDVAEGEILALVGESGCGKSTLLRMLAGLEIPTRGRIALSGQTVSEGPRTLPAERRGVAMVFQDHALFPHLRVSANVGFGLRGVPRAQRSARIQSALTLVGLPELGRRYIHELSGGQRQRVALARALAPEPKVLLLDEPLSSLDERLRAELRDDIASLLRDRGTTAIWVTHRAEDAMAVADRAAVLHHGKLIQLDDPITVYRQPQTAYVARLFGEANLLSPHVAGLLTPTPPSAGPSTFMVRPESLRLVDIQAREGVEGTVEHIRPLGAADRVKVRLSDGSTVLLMSATTPRPRVGESVKLLAEEGSLHPIPDGAET